MAASHESVANGQAPAMAHSRIVSAAINYDARLTRRDGNSFRLAVFLRGIEAMEAEESCCWAHRLYDNFSDRILTAFENALDLPVTHGNGRPDRRPTTCANGNAAATRTPARAEAPDNA